MLPEPVGAEQLAADRTDERLLPTIRCARQQAREESWSSRGWCAGCHASINGVVDGTLAVNGPLCSDRDAGDGRQETGKVRKTLRMLIADSEASPGIPRHSHLPSPVSRLSLPGLPDL